jgi:hypothetical protein
MGQMKYIFQLITQDRIEELAEAYQEALQDEKQMFTFDNSYMSIERAKNIIAYAQEHSLYIENQKSRSNTT